MGEANTEGRWRIVVVRVILRFGFLGHACIVKSGQGESIPSPTGFSGVLRRFCGLSVGCGLGRR